MLHGTGDAARYIEIRLDCLPGLPDLHSVGNPARVDGRPRRSPGAVQDVVEAAGFAVVRNLVGHGVGRYYHEDPHIPNFGEPGRGPRLSDGMTIAIEPMITAGGPDIEVADDGWTITTEDGSMSAHFEHTVAITGDGPRILTPRVGLPARTLGV